MTLSNTLSTCDTQQVISGAGISDRQLNFWTLKGHLRADIDAPGSGRPRAWANAEVRIAAIIKRLRDSGFELASAARLARGAVEDGDTIVEINPSIKLVIGSLE